MTKKFQAPGKSRIVIRFKYEGQVPSKSNFRRGGNNWRGRWKRIKAFEDEVGWLVLRAWSGSGEKGTMLDLAGPITVSVLPFNQNIDVNNITKILCDSLQGVCYADDKEVGVNFQPMKHDNRGGRMYLAVRWGE